MNKIPCIICLTKVDSNDPRILATICKNCLTDENIKNIGKNFGNEDLQKVLKKAKEMPEINEFGEII